ncbi:MAG: tRNA (guanosine(37)-N1)-methyltransferase TrmD [Verrucomicrobiales bacterium]|jgi:tRNA (guanine37-N1)-methyltransferase|nr:tRNA (guanosine(37)-N1)-methyltransferase TrmD [Verrucomicrobiales bacterium]MBP9223756.1 tRNA (guanosine(37)-N1)-methyltransferase TrmD [Verrucomicrobiales bacterium]HQZ28782.1 tRNA (guanosine(37)-N1)-methyltransferase TrmD [Verrucomicrobiales bacterium]
MKIDIVTIFPEIARGPLSVSMMGRAVEAGKVAIHYHDLRDFTTDRHRQVDDIPYGGGPGMVMKPEPFFAAVEALRTAESKILLLTPQGQTFRQAKAVELSHCGHLIFLCGHYEGVDHRVIEALVDEEISIGDYVLTNGTIATAVVVDAIVRLIPGVLGDERSAEIESFSGEGNRLEAPHYTRPAEYAGMTVPPVLLSGNHGAIAKWREEEGEVRTRENRPDLLGGGSKDQAP